MKTYDFDKELKYSQDVYKDLAKVLKTRYKALAVYPAHPKNDRKGIDLIVELEGRITTVDAKIRKVDFGYSDCALETWSVLDSKIGWTICPDKLNEWVLFFWMDSGASFLVDAAKLRTVFKANYLKWTKAYKTAQQFTPGFGGYKSECCFVPIRVIKQAIKSLNNSPEKP